MPKYNMIGSGSSTQGVNQEYKLLLFSVSIILGHGLSIFFFTVQGQTMNNLSFADHGISIATTQ